MYIRSNIHRVKSLLREIVTCRVYIGAWHGGFADGVGIAKNCFSQGALKSYKNFKKTTFLFYILIHVYFPIHFYFSKYKYEWEDKNTKVPIPDNVEPNI